MYRGLNELEQGVRLQVFCTTSIEKLLGDVITRLAVATVIIMQSSVRAVQ